MAKLTEKTMPISQVFPIIDPVFTRDLLNKNAYEIGQHTEALLQDSQPEQDPKINLMIEAIISDRDLAIVRAVANAFALSEGTLQQLFTTYVGVGIKWILMRTRLLEAVESVHVPERPD